MTAARPAVGYARVSSEEQAAEGVSLAAQAEAIRGYAVLRGLDLVETAVDPGVSAGIPLAGRPNGRHILDLIREGRVTAVVAYRLDRLFRDAADCLAVTRQWDASGIALHLLDMGGQSVDLSSATGRFFLTVMAGAAEMERNLIRERICFSYDRLRATGIYHSTRPPFGYRREYRQYDGRERAFYLLDEPAASLVRELFDRFLAGANLTDLAVWMTQEGAEMRYGGQTVWTSGRVRSIIANPIYAGMLFERGRGDPRPVRAAVNVEPLVSLATHEGVAAVLRAHTRLTIHPGSRGAAGLFGSLLTCDVCGSRLWRSGEGRHHGPVRYRCCRAMHRMCEQPSVNEGQLWSEVLPHLVELMDPRRAQARAAREARSSEQTGRRLAEVRASLQRLTSAYQHASSRMTEGEFLAAAEPLWSERDRLEGAPPPEALPMLGLPRDRRELRGLLNALDVPERRTLLQRVVVQIRIRDGRLAAPPRFRGA